MDERRSYDILRELGLSKTEADIYRYLSRRGPQKAHSIAAHLRMFNCKVKYSQGELSYLTEEELTDLLKGVGLRISKKD